MNRAFGLLGAALLVACGVPTASAGACSDDIYTLPAAIDRAKHVTAHGQYEQQEALSHGSMRKSTGRDVSELYDPMTAQVATSGQDAARQSAGKPTIFQAAAQRREGRLAKAEVVLKRARQRDMAKDAKACQKAVAHTRRLLLGG